MYKSRGVIMFAHNNEEIDYFRIACANALLVKQNLDVPVAIYTDQRTLDWGISSLGEDFVNKCFPYILIDERDYVYQQNNPRVYRDTLHTTKSLPFYNCNHWVAYDISPFDETLFIDSDYFVMSDTLNNCWNSNNDVMINYDILNMATMNPLQNTYIDEFGIKQYWATIVYFRKSALAENLFTLVKHVFENYTFYRELYLIHGAMFRNDYAFSIAVHMLNGFSSNESFIPQLPIGKMNMSFDSDDILKLNGINDITLYTANPQEKGKFTLLRCKDTDIHLMNKYASRRISDDVIKIYSKELGIV